MMSTMMACGHTANATRAGRPVCVICWGIHDGAGEIAETADLVGRVAMCVQCGKTNPSSTELAFFKSQPDAVYDSYYSGCDGWS